MNYLKHEHDTSCEYGSMLHYLVEAHPQVLWYSVQDVGSYQGSVYAIGTIGNEVILYRDYYGSCSGCGAWGEGGEPESVEDVMKRSTVVKNIEEAEKLIRSDDWKYDSPDSEELIKKAKEAFNDIAK